MTRPSPKRLAQRGFALLGLVALLVTGVLYVLVGQFDASKMRRDQDLATLQALAQAKEALIAYAVAVDLSGAGRPGDLPCPDRNNDGRKEVSCGNAAGTTFQDRRLGRLPWFDLGLPDIRDSSGERLWYAVSSNFKENTRAAILNSDTVGTITIRDANGNIILDASGGSGAVAVIIAPGPPLARLDGLQQDRSAGNINNPLHYLDNIAAEDNADFDETVTLTNGFFAGPARDAINPEVIVANDRIAFITRDEIIKAIETRVAAEVMSCLRNYAAYNDGTFNNLGRYPWAASIATSALPYDVVTNPCPYCDATDTKFGRVPEDLANTQASQATMLSTWGSVANCSINGTWFKANWREQVFYALADAYKPGAGGPTCGSCLTVDAVNNKQVAVFVAGKKIGAQSRSSAVERAQVSQYLEGENNNGDTVFVTQPASPSFNDRVLYR